MYSQDGSSRSAGAPMSRQSPASKSPSQYTRSGSSQLRCANDPNQFAIGYCPDLDTPLCQDSFDKLKAMPALSHIDLVPLHKMDEKRRRDPETQDPYTLYDKVLGKPIPTIAKLVGNSREHEVVSIEEAATEVREDLRIKIRQLSDQLSSVRVAQSHVEKLIFNINANAVQTKDEIEAYFGEFHERLERRRKETLREFQVALDNKVGPLKQLTERLPVMREKAHQASDKANEIMTSSDLELLFKKKEVEIMLSAAELRLECSPDWITETKGGLKFECDDRYLFLNESCRVLTQRRDPDLEQCVSTIATLLGQHPSYDEQGQGNQPIRLSQPMSQNAPTRQDRALMDAGAKQDGSSRTGSPWETFSEPPRAGYGGDVGFDAAKTGGYDAQPALEDRRKEAFGRTAFGLLPDQADQGGRNMTSPIPDRPLRPQTYQFDSNYMDACLQISSDCKSLARRSPKAVSGLACTKQLLPPGERVDITIEELNLYLPASGWIGVTPVRSLSSLQENALYLDLATGSIMNNDIQVATASEGEFALCEGDVISMVLHTDRSLTFFLNRRPVSRPITDCPDLVYPFVNVSGKVIKLSILED